MIDQILELIVESRITDKREIAKHVGVQLETLDDVIDLLCRRGYLRTGQQNCTQSSHCSGCSMVDSCGSIDRYGIVLFITDKAKKYLQARRKEKHE